MAQTTHWTFWPSLAIILVLLILGKPLLGLFGDGFADGYPLMIIFSVGLLARAAVGPSERLLSMLGLWRIAALTYLAAFAGNLALCAALIPSLGAIGADIALSVALVAGIHPAFCDDKALCAGKAGHDGPAPAGCVPRLKLRFPAGASSPQASLS